MAPGRSGRGAAAAALAALVAACGGEASPPPAPIPFAEYGAASWDATCAWALKCKHFPDDATCRRMLDPKSFDTRRASDSIASGRLRYDPQAAGRCLASGRAAACSAPPFDDASCTQVFVGRVAGGGACTRDSECAGGGTCNFASCVPGCCTGTCAPSTTPDAGPPPARDGAPCRTHTDCMYVSFCGDNFRCQPLPTREGQHCLFGCATGDLYCDVDSEICHAYALIGAPCSAARHCNNLYAYCDPDGTCKPRPGPGEICDDEDRRCIPTATCDADAGACSGRGGAGDRCAADRQCDVACDADAGQCIGYSTCQPR